MLVDFHNKTPDQITEVQLQDYFLHRKNKDKWSPATMRICYSGIKFFFINVLKREWHTLELIHVKTALDNYALTRILAPNIDNFLLIFMSFYRLSRASSRG